MRIALAQLNQTVGDLPGNSERIIEAIRRARSEGADLVVTPELSVCGYPPRDLIDVEDFVSRCAAATKAIGEAETQGITAIIGTPLPADGGGIANSLVIYRDNQMVDYYDKRLLPTYDVFDEDRYFEPGGRTVVIEVVGRRIGLAICEDLWRGEDAGFSHRYADAPDPVGELAQLNIDLLVVPSASPFVIEKHARHRSILSKHAQELAVPVVSVNQVGGNDDLIFDGRSCVLSPDGNVHATAEAFESDLLVVDPDHPGETLEDDRPVELAVIEALTIGVRDYLGKCGFKTACLGLSGGIDSALTAAIAARAVGAENLTGAAMPGQFSSEGSVTDAYALAENLGMRCITMPITPGFDGQRGVLDQAFAELGHRALGESLPDLAQENLQSRVRGALMMAISNRTGALLLTTGNKSELAVGYCTLYGDMNGGLAVLSDVPKTLVFSISRYMNERWEKLGFNCPPIPVSTIEKPPSAELAPDQLDTDSLPPYEVLDEIVERHVESRQSSRRIVDETGFNEQTVARICRLIDLNEYKRRQLAVGLKITHVAFGAGRRMPIAQRWVR